MTSTVLMFILPTVAILLIVLSIGSQTDERPTGDHLDESV